MKKNNKGISIFKIILVVDIIVLFLMFICILYKNNNTEDKNKVFNFKKFNYIISNNLEFTAADDDKFRIDGNDWYATVEIYIDRFNEMYENTDIYFKVLSTNDYEITEPEIKNIHDNKVVIFTKPQNKTILCYLSTINEYAYEIEIFNNDGSLDIEPIYDMIDILQNVTINANDNTNYHFDIIDFSKIKNQEIDNNTD